MKTPFSSLLLGGVLLCSLAGCHKETAIPLPAQTPPADPLTVLSVERAKLMGGTWRTLASGADLNKNGKLDSNEINPQLGEYPEFADYKSDGSGTFRMVNSDNNTTFQTYAFRWHISNNGENITVVSAADSAVATILKLTENTFEWSRKTVTTQWLGFWSR